MVTRLRSAVVLATAVLSLAGCASEGDRPVAGADPAKAGPQGEVGPRSAAPDSGAVPTGTPTASAPEDPLEALRQRLVTALRAADPGAAAGTLTVEQRPAAENQLVITWTVNTDPSDTTARARVRLDAIALLQAVKGVSMGYGTVLLIATGAVLDKNGIETEAKVVRAKYSRQLIARTDFTKVSPEQVLALPDDKPADIHPAYR
ncbi:hypothetical protein F4553_000468 [Allocatelliglobosispora scoriae]|uniref:Lipoprotein n=1 Tax=Allocatelliglobosispora scoriae TaxID=643052 RepID=A0A841BIU6_9ACTN|nr:hypothetical protein [Allocatelliglobosispora scoriae]MBB5867089.1 hypothetical protein [Allocatelliglobosispora scoriae]